MHVSRYFGCISTSKLVARWGLGSKASWLWFLYGFDSDNGLYGNEVLWLFLSIKTSFWSKGMEWGFGRGHLWLSNSSRYSGCISVSKLVVGWGLGSETCRPRALSVLDSYNGLYVSRYFGYISASKLVVGWGLGSEASRLGALWLLDSIDLFVWNKALRVGFIYYIV